MNTLSKHLFAALLGTAILSSCSRPVAYFQPSARESFKLTQTETAVAVAPVEAAQPVSAVSPVEVSMVAPATSVEAQLAQTKQAVKEVDAYVRNDNKLASNKKLTKRMERLNEMLATTSAKATVATNTASPKKMSLMERTMLKKMDKKIKNHVAPDQTKAMNSNVRLGIIIGIVGLLLLILGGGSVLGVIGGIGFVVGLVLVLLGIINS
ncbi:hypothetical protein [Spirosoma fluviale]|uniref:Uncharacterized protein n=1 Tax=Spirosoma fluviale TaxID=1597977 RepID=A0A286GT80_9BACT|nr:hypothetical protein [Spirosoma fluviale]SOD98743.1 hypothetical protein SAMN06269250_6212 [Spirosoma fluviale]